MFAHYMEARSFSEVLQEKLDSAGIKAAELSRRSGVSPQNISKILKGAGAEKETVKKLAAGLRWDVNEALKAADFAPIEEVADLFVNEDITVKFRPGAFSEEQEKALVYGFKIWAVGLVGVSAQKSPAITIGDETKRVYHPSYIKNDDEQAEVKEKAG